MAISLLGCAQKTNDETVTLSDAHKKFIEICKDEYNLDVLLTPLKNTVWIYIPMDHSLFEYKASKQPTAQTTKVNDHFALNKLETEFINNQFIITYDINREKFYPKNYGYESKNNDKFYEKYRAVYGAISRAYFELTEETEHIKIHNYNEDPTQEKTYLPRDQVPEFFVITFTDIIAGIETQMILNLDDYKKYSVGFYPQEEYNLRTLNETRGNIEAMGDKAGKHLKIHEILMGDFLARQIKNRINFKFTKSDFPPKENPEMEILKAAAITIKSYDFQEFENLTTKDLRMKTEHAFFKQDIYDFDAEPTKPKGKIHVIKFN